MTVTGDGGISLEHLLTITIQPDPFSMLGDFPLGERRMVTLGAGRFEGRDGLRGTLAPGGTDWQVVRRDGVIEIDAHYLLLTDEVEPIEVRSTGVRGGSADVADRQARGERVDPSEYYFRTHITLRTSSTRWDRLNRIIAVSSGERLPGEVVVHVFEVR